MTDNQSSRKDFPKDFDGLTRFFEAWLERTPEGKHCFIFGKDRRTALAEVLAKIEQHKNQISYAHFIADILVPMLDGVDELMKLRITAAAWAEEDLTPLYRELLEPDIMLILVSAGPTIIWLTEGAITEAQRERTKVVRKVISETLYDLPSVLYLKVDDIPAADEEIEVWVINSITSPVYAKFGLPNFGLMELLLKTDILEMLARLRL